MCILLALFISLCVTLYVYLPCFLPVMLFLCSVVWQNPYKFFSVPYLYSPLCKVYFNDPFPYFPCCCYSIYFPVYFVGRLFHIVIIIPLCFLLLVKQFSVLLCRITLYDYQAMCRTNKESSDSAHSLLDVSIVNFLSTFPCNHQRKLLQTSHGHCKRIILIWNAYSSCIQGMVHYKKMQSVKHFQAQILTQSFLLLDHDFWGSVRIFFAPYESSFLGLCKFGNRLCLIWGTGITNAFSVCKHIHAEM